MPGFPNCCATTIVSSTCYGCAPNTAPQQVLVTFNDDWPTGDGHCDCTSLKGASFLLDSSTTDMNCLWLKSTTYDMKGTHPFSVCSSAQPINFKLIQYDSSHTLEMNFPLLGSHWFSGSNSTSFDCSVSSGYTMQQWVPGLVPIFMPCLFSTSVPSITITPQP